MRHVMVLVLLMALAGCGTAERRVVSSAEEVAPAELPVLAAPEHGSMAGGGPALLDPADGPVRSEVFFLEWSCQEIGAWLGAAVPVLADPPAQSATPMCALVGPSDRARPTDPSGRDEAGRPVTLALHVLYLPTRYDLDAQTYLELVGAGMIDVSVSFTPDVENPASEEARPDDFAGGYAPFDIRGERAVVQRIAAARVRASWWEETVRGRARHTITSPYEPDQTVALAREMTTRPDGPPGAVRDRRR